MTDTFLAKLQAREREQNQRQKHVVRFAAFPNHRLHVYRPVRDCLLYCNSYKYITSALFAHAVHHILKTQD